MKSQSRPLATICLLTLSLLFGCAAEDENSAPVIQSITASDVNPTPGEIITLSCVASDPDGDALSYLWKANGTEIGENAASISWQTPSSAATVSITVEVSDGTTQAQRNLSVVVGTDEFLLLSGLTDAGFAGWNTGWSREASWVHQNLGDLLIVDVEGSGFANGHIAGAHHVLLSNLVDWVEANNPGSLEIVLVCDTGQISAFAAMGLRMLGHDATSLKWGMAGWNDSQASDWDTAISNDFATEMVTSSSPQLPQHDWPALNTGLTSAQAILRARVEAVFQEGLVLNEMTASQVMDNPASLNISNYWVQSDYEDIGHINGSYQVNPGSLTTQIDLSALHPTEENVLYCWTGQTSAFTVFYLNVLGYNAFSMKFGANALMYDDLTQQQWSQTHLNYPVVTD